MREERKTKAKKPASRDGSSRRYRSIVITFLLDIAFAVFAYWLARTVMFYSEDVTMPDLYNRYELAVAAVVIIITVAMLVFFDCYNAVWRYAGRVEFFKFLLAYIASFIALMLLKLVLGFAFQTTCGARSSSCICCSAPCCRARRVFSMPFCITRRI